MFTAYPSHLKTRRGLKLCASTLVVIIISVCSTTEPVLAQVITSPYNSYPQRECRGLSAMNAAQLKILAATHNPFWIGGERQQQAYLAAFHGGEDGVRQFQKSNQSDITDRAAIVLAAIGRRDITMLRDNYDGKINVFFMKQMRSNTLYWAAMCNFYDGARFLVTHGVSPNEVFIDGTSAFNVSLLYPHSKIPKLLMDEGYGISDDYKWCKSSKYTLRLYADRIDSAVAAKIRQSACVDPR